MSAAGVYHSGGSKVDWGTTVGAVGGWGLGSISKNHTSHHKSKSPKHFLLIAYSN